MSSTPNDTPYRVLDMPAIETTTEWLWQQIRDHDWMELSNDKPQPSTNCPSCHGRGTVPGDWVPYGSTSTQLPGAYCDCMDDAVWEFVTRQAVSGEWVLRDGRYQPE